jgi:hypothetical protein
MFFSKQFNNLTRSERTPTPVKSAVAITLAGIVQSVSLAKMEVAASILIVWIVLFD